MATKIATNKFRVHSVNKFIDSVQSTTNSNSYYVFAARSNVFDNEASPPAVTDSIDEIHYNIYDEMLFGKRVANNDVVPMIRRINWQSGNTFHQYNNVDTSLDEKNFYCVSQEGANYYVFKCLDNNNNTAANDQPLFSETSAEDSLYQTNDGFIWKYMYTISSSNWSKFATSSYVPVIIDSDVTANAVSGTIDLINLNSGGLRYDAYANGTILVAAVGGDTTKFNLATGTQTLSNSSDFYNTSVIYIRSGTGAGQVRTIDDYTVSGSTYQITVNTAFTTLPDITSVFEIRPQIAISGDGTGALAIANINTSANSISKIEMINVGSGYSYANITISSNTTDTITAANLTPIISPFGGHGSDVKNELIAKYVGISTTFANNESGTIPTTNDYRKIGLLKDPLFANVTINLTQSVASSFVDGETVIQYVPQASNTLIRSFNYTLARYQTLGIESNTGFSVSDSISFEDKSGTVLEANTSEMKIRLDADSSIFATSDKIGDGTVTRTISSVSQANPATVVTSNAHGISNASSIVFYGLDGTALDYDSAPTTYYARVTNTTAFQVYIDSGLSTTFDNSANTAATTGYVTIGSAVTNVTSAAYTHTGLNDPIEGYDDAGNRFGMIPSTGTDLPLTMLAYYNGSSVAFTQNTTAFTLTGKTLAPASDTAKVEIYTSVEAPLTADYVGRSSGIISSRSGKTLQVANVSGTFETDFVLKGLTSGTEATIDTLGSSFNTFNQTTQITAQIISTGDSGGGIADTGFVLDDPVTHSNGATGRIFAISNTITRAISSVSIAANTIITTSSAHGYANGQSVTFTGLNGSAINSANTYWLQTVNSTAFYLYNDVALSTPFDNSANSAANTGIVMSSGIGSTGNSSFRTFYINNIEGNFTDSGTFSSDTTSATVSITESIAPDLVDNTGEILYLENVIAIERADDQSEKIKIIFEY